MLEPFKIFIDRLKGGQTEKIDEVADPKFLDVDEKELSFPSKIEVKGEAYLTDDFLMIRLKVKAVALMPCAICNEMIKRELKVDNFIHAEPIEDIPSAVFDFGELLREALLLDLPQYIECNNGNCPERASITPFLRSQARAENKTTYFPFADMNDKDIK